MLSWVALGALVPLQIVLGRWGRRALDNHVSLGRFDDRALSVGGTARPNPHRDPFVVMATAWRGMSGGNQPVPVSAEERFRGGPALTAYLVHGLMLVALTFGRLLAGSTDPLPNYTSKSAALVGIAVTQLALIVLSSWLTLRCVVRIERNHRDVER